MYRTALCMLCVLLTVVCACVAAVQEAMVPTPGGSTWCSLLPWACVGIAADGLVQKSRSKSAVGGSRSVYSVLLLRPAGRPARRWANRCCGTRRAAATACQAAAAAAGMQGRLVL